MQLKKIKYGQNGEYLQLRELWQRVFGDTEEYIDSLYTGLAAVGYGLFDEAGRLVSELSVFDGGELERPGSSCRVKVLYAICTDEAYRGRGHASELIRTVKEELLKAGYLCLVAPAESSLTEYYSELGFALHCPAVQKVWESCEKEGFEESDFDEEEGIFMPSMRTAVEIIDAETYSRLREEYLAGCEHIAISEALLRFARADSVGGEGTLLINRGDAICLLNRGDADELMLSELIINPELLERSSEIDEQLAEGLAELFEVERIIYRMPSREQARPASGEAAEGEAAQTPEGEAALVIEGEAAPSAQAEAGVYVQALLAGNCEPREPYFGLVLD